MTRKPHCNEYLRCWTVQTLSCRRKCEASASEAPEKQHFECTCLSGTWSLCQQNLAKPLKVQNWNEYFTVHIRIVKFKPKKGPENEYFTVHIRIVKFKPKKGPENERIHCQGFKTQNRRTWELGPFSWSWDSKWCLFSTFVCPRNPRP